ncbi:MAG TPA: glycosyltransferase family 87 protein [Phycisphaerae bacterium]|nr:glycosyltransferase family 87 protein [Phycisphaerae bacterium]
MAASTADEPPNDGTARGPRRADGRGGVVGRAGVVERGGAGWRVGVGGLVSRAVRTLTSHRWLVVFCAANALGCGVVTVRYLASLDGALGPQGEVITGDFMHFYLGGRMILEGDGAALYDVAAQGETQARIVGPQYGKVHWYNYPPTFAVALAPLSALPYVWAFYVYDLLMAAAMAATLWMLRPLLPALGRYWGVTVLAVVFFHPIIRNIVGGQNTVLTVFLMTGVYVGLRTDRGVLAGVFLGLLLYKPQLVLLLGLILLVRGALRPVMVAGVVGMGHYLVGAVFCGASWPMTFLKFLAWFGPVEARLNRATHFSLLRVCEFSLPAAWAHVAAGVMMLAVLAIVIRFARQHAASEAGFAVSWALAITGAVLISPYAQYYDAGILVLPVLLGLDYVLQQGRDPSAKLRLLLVAGYVLYPIYEVSRAIQFQPLVLWPVLILIWLTGVLSGSGGSADTAGSDPPTTLWRSWLSVFRPAGAAPTTRVSR